MQFSSSIGHTLQTIWCRNKGNSSIPLFEIHQSIEKKNNSGLHTKTDENTSNLRGDYGTTET